MKRRDLYLVVAIATLVVVLAAVYHERRTRYDFIGSNEGGVWKIDRRTGETFFCAPFRGRNGYTEPACILAQMPDWYTNR